MADLLWSLVAVLAICGLLSIAALAIAVAGRPQLVVDLIDGTARAWLPKVVLGSTAFGALLIATLGVRGLLFGLPLWFAGSGSGFGSELVRDALAVALGSVAGIWTVRLLVASARQRLQLAALAYEREVIATVMRSSPEERERIAIDLEKELLAARRPPTPGEQPMHAARLAVIAAVKALDSAALLAIEIQRRAEERRLLPADGADADPHAAPAASVAAPMPPPASVRVTRRQGRSPGGPAGSASDSGTWHSRPRQTKPPVG